MAEDQRHTPRRALCGIASVVLLSAVGRGTGQEPRRPEPTFSASTRTVRVPVSVLDRGGAPVLGLRETDFQVSEDGRRQQVTLFSGERRPLRIALALDLSGSMENKIRQVELALKHFIGLLEPRDEILVLTFNSHVRVLQDFTSDRALLDQVLDELQPGGSTALYDAASQAIGRVAPGPAESKAVVLVSDGVDTDSTTTFESLRELARRSEVPVFSIGLDTSSRLRNLLPSFSPHAPGGSSRIADFDARPLRALAEETGGWAEILKGGHDRRGGLTETGAARLREAVESIAVTLRHRYLIGYEPPEGDRGWREIRIEVQRPSATARARRGYYPG